MEVQTASGQTLRASDLQGSRVVNQEGDRLGTLDDLVVEIDQGTLSYAIVAAGGFLGIGADWRPVPPESFQIREVALGHELVLDLTQEQWEQAPSVEREQIDQLAQEARGQQIYEFYGADWQAREQRGTEFAAPAQERAELEIDSPDAELRVEAPQEDEQVKQLEQQLEQSMTQAGVEREQAQQEAERLAQQFSREKPDQDEIEKQLEQALQQAGVEQDRAEQEAQRLSQQVHQQIEFAAPPQSRGQESPRSPGQTQSQEPREPKIRQQQEQEFGEARQQQQGAASQKVRLASDIQELTIQNQEQQEIGEVSDLLINLDQGRIPFVVFTEGTGLFPGDEEFAVAPQALEISQDQATLNITQQDLQGAQMLTRQQVQQQGEEMQDPQQARQQPQVFRYQDENGAPGVYGTPGQRESEQSEPAPGEEEPELEQPQRQPPPPHEQESAQPSRPQQEPAQRQQPRY